MCNVVAEECPNWISFRKPRKICGAPNDERTKIREHSKDSAEHPRTTTRQHPSHERHNKGGREENSLNGELHKV